MRALLPSFMRYTAVGACATAMHYLVLVLCVEQGWLPAWAASGLGAIVGAQVAYAGNRWFTFAYRGEVGRSWLRFQGTAAFGAVLGMAVVAGAVAMGLHYLLAQIVATGLILALTYAINRAWTFE